MLRMPWVALGLFKMHVASASLLGTDFSGAQLDALFGLVKSLGMTREEMEEFHELWLAELERESPDEHAVVQRLLAEGKDLLEAMRHIFAKRGGAEVRARAAEYKALPAAERAPLRKAAWDELVGNPLALSQPASGRFVHAAKGAGVSAGMRRGAAGRAATGAALPVGFAVHGFRVAAAAGATPPAALAAAVSAGAAANGERTRTRTRTRTRRRTCSRTRTLTLSRGPPRTSSAGPARGSPRASSWCRAGPSVCAAGPALFWCCCLCCALLATPRPQPATANRPRPLARFASLRAAA